MINKKLLFYLLGVVMIMGFIPLVSADIAFYKFSGDVTDETGTYDATNNGATFPADFPTFNDTGTGTPNSADFVSASSQYVKTPQGLLTSMISADSFTVSTWVKGDSGVGNKDKYFYSGGGGGTFLGVAIGVGYSNTERARCFVGYSGSAPIATGTTNVSDGNWHHVVCTYDGTDLKIYVDGIQEGTASAPSPVWSSTDTSYIARQGSGYYRGNLDEMHFSDTTYTAQQIRNLYNCNDKDTSSCSAPSATLFSIAADDEYTGTAITNFSAYTFRYDDGPCIPNGDCQPITTYGDLWSTTNGTIVTTIQSNDTSEYQILVFSNQNGGYFNRTYGDDYEFPAGGITGYNVSSNLEAELHQSEATFYATKKVTGDNITEFNISTTSFSGSANNEGTNPTLNLSANNNFSFTLQKNGYYQRTQSGFNTTPKNSSNFTITDVYDHILSVQINILNGSTTDQNFNITITDRDGLGYEEGFSTNNGSVEAGLTSGVNYTVALNDTIHQYKEYNITLNSSQNFTAITIDVYGTNSVRFRFYNTDGDPLAASKDVFITGGIESYSFTTTNTTYYIELLEPDSYTVTYSATGYYTGRYFFSLSNQTTNQIDLYFTSENESEIVVTVIDELTARISNATVRLQQKNLSGTNYYQVDSCKTNQEGQCLLHGNIGTTTYRVALIYEGEVKRITDDFQFITSSATYRITLSTNPLTTIEEYQNIVYTLAAIDGGISVGYSFAYADLNNNVLTACLSVDKIIRGSTTNEEFCNSGASGSLSPEILKSNYEEICGEPYFIISSSGQRVYGEEICVLVDTAAADNFGQQGLFLYGVVFLGSIILSVALLGAGAVLIPLISGVLVFFGYWLGFISITQSAVISFVVLSIVVLMVVSKK